MSTHDEVKDKPQNPNGFLLIVVLVCFLLSCISIFIAVTVVFREKQKVIEKQKELEIRDTLLNNLQYIEQAIEQYNKENAPIPQTQEATTHPSLEKD